MLNKIMNEPIKDKSLSSSNVSLNSLDNYYTKENDRTVYLGDLDLDTSERQILEFFSSHNKNRSIIKIIKQPHSSFAHVTFDDANIARSLIENAIIHINNKVIRVMPFNQPNNFDPNANLIIKNLESYVNESDIIHKFKEFGDILSCKLVRDEDGHSKCYAFLQFKDKSSASHAIDHFNNTYWDERCDPDYKFKKYQEKLSLFITNQPLGKLNEADFQENELFADFSNKMGKKIYVGVFKKKDEYSKIKSDKEGKPSNLYVKNFGNNFGDRDLFNLFKSFGSIKSAKVRRNKVGMIEKPLGCGFVDFENPDEAEEARKALDNYKLPDSGRVISVKYADCKSRRMRKKLEENNTNESSMIKNRQSNNYQERTRSSYTLTTTTSAPLTLLPSIETNLSLANPDESSSSSSSIIIDHQKNRKASTSSISSTTFSSSNSSTKSSSSPPPFLVSPSSPNNDQHMDIMMLDHDLLYQFEWPDVWSKLLQSNDWNEYKLFA